MSLLPSLARLDLEARYIGKMFSKVASAMPKCQFPLATDEDTEISMSQLDRQYGETLLQNRCIPPFSMQTDEITEEKSNNLDENGHNSWEDASFYPIAEYQSILG